MLTAKDIEIKLTEFHSNHLDLPPAGWQKTKKEIIVTENSVTITIHLGYPCAQVKAALIADLTAFLSKAAPDMTFTIDLPVHIEEHVGKSAMPPLSQIKNIIAIASGKGGVGKSTVAANLAYALLSEGAAVGLLDADIYGPSQPTLLATSEVKPAISGKNFLPVVSRGLKTMSMGYLIGQLTPMVWRGPMIGKALQQLLHDTEWGELDYLVIDLPPGTGDIQLTLAQKFPLSGVVMVTTPQEVALADVQRACEMFNKVNVPLLGVIENMSYYQCAHCGHEATIFAQGAGERLAKQYELPLLATLPLDAALGEVTQGGKYKDVFSQVARKVAAMLTLQPKSYARKFAKIVVEQR